MLKQATVQEIKDKRITKLHGLLVVVTRYYPRYLKKNLISEYQPVLAPTLKLLKTFKALEAEHNDHNEAFVQCDYQQIFQIPSEAYDLLQSLTIRSEHDDVYLVCHCSRDQYCHRELLLLLAQHHFQAQIPTLSHDYEEFKDRLLKE